MVDLRYSSTSHNEYDQEHGDAAEYFFSDNDEEPYHTQSKPYMIRWKSGKRVDPRLLTTLESFKEIYDENRDLFEKILFPSMYNEFVDVFNKLGDMRERNKEARTMERSLSLRSPRPCFGLEMDDDEKFRVRPPTIIIGGLDGGKSG